MTGLNFGENMLVDKPERQDANGSLANDDAFLRGGHFLERDGDLSLV
jgi:hypothetical protein